MNHRESSILRGNPIPGQADSNNFANFELEGTLVANLAITLSTLAGIAAFSQLKNPILIVSFVRVPARV